ncbi:putative RIO kinase [Ordospora colligata]|uniref:non-specific serine/threonine protein kinase n=1 Tax=Ordospora colligata OC4 TaxID=1354746 RepID=A0A0B2UHE0_9MICR|nr:putative RIO kinase [Ordospora colligata OC4]KHN70491.1 putative RIO kinase [Ordospora colligata OC4]TBU17241.1 putative RIO kinase [Ordospora colligata]TBU17491.1 putative RIO kinase [Ordospora colligata]TBU19671.1 putative RIO kinase [Ordospora colligata]
MKNTKTEKRRKDKSDRATVDKVLDKRTMNILDKIQDRGKLANLRGSLCTGKEANVYLAMASTDLQSKFINNRFEENKCQNAIMRSEEMIAVAVKIFKTSIMPFKDRERYIRSEKRFQKFCTSNPRKLVKVWAEKEARNLKRLNAAGIPSPRPMYLRSNVLVMSLIGEYDCVAPRLRDAKIEDVGECYMQCIGIIKEMYCKARLVHADLSEYNLLYYKGVVNVIDVGQSVEIDHENAQRFLIMDISNVNVFFEKKGVLVASVNDVFEDVTGMKIPVCMEGMEIVSDVFIPSRVSEVRNKEDFEIFGREVSGDAMSIEESEHSDESEEFSSEMKENNEGESTKNAYEEKKKRKSEVKEFNRLRRASRISNKEKKKIFKKYVGKNHKKR